MIFKKLIAIEPLNLIPSAEKQLESFAESVTIYNDRPSSIEEIVNRIGDADGVLVSYSTTLGSESLEQCPNIKYVGMCCSLYSPESANVDIAYANSRGIVVDGIRDYGDEGVVEYVVSELIRCLHGFGTYPDGTQRKPWSEIPREITGIKVGIVGLGKSGGMIADALHFFGAEVSYFSRTRKPESEEKGYRFLPLNELLAENEVIVTCLNKNTILLHEEEFQHLGSRKILFNTGLSPAWDEEPFLKWLSGDNLAYCDTVGALGSEKLVNHPKVVCMEVSSGRTSQAFIRLSEKVLANITSYLKKQSAT
ncbi:D-isomer specific 2-hydroxyacid dehydrogenase family protein [Kaistella flava (ex Peng et al. 2021)]|uniref:D-isomer specific 2-hydroxyacid dehydrogenase family protein n=1 Tax=Kaistella flava (ex Peng et al. 2021) TaxID=2038776 RepID=UPI001ABA1109|nr:D-isomer specific 2-hydroxyacid dehydrogenase family protein [Kaistella flava (ex Peng et al. 2021)]